MEKIRNTQLNSRGKDELKQKQGVAQGMTALSVSNPTRALDTLLRLSSQSGKGPGFNNMQWHFNQFPRRGQNSINRTHRYENERTINKTSRLPTGLDIEVTFKLNG